MSWPTFDLWLLAWLVLLLMTTGAVAGVLAGLLGVGGGIVIVPMLFQLFTLLELEENVRMLMAVGTSLSTIVPTAFISARAHYQCGNVDVILLRKWGAWVFLGAIAGTRIASTGGWRLLIALFVAVSFLEAIYVIFMPEDKTLFRRLPGRVSSIGLAALIGCISVMIGIGGGTLTVPVLLAFSYPIRKAIGTAAAFGVIITLPGAIGFALDGEGIQGRLLLTVGYVNLIGFLFIVPVTLLTAPLGVYLANIFKPANLRRAFAFFLLLTSIRMAGSLL